MRMDICDEIRVAEANWIVKQGNKPSQVILPKAKYEALLVVCRERMAEEPSGFEGVGYFNGVRVYSYDGDVIVFS